MKKIFLGLILTSVILFSSCEIFFGGMIDFLEAVAAGSGTPGFVEPSSGDSQTIKGRAYNKAADYVNTSTRYELGTMGRYVIPFDCSGLVTRCYEEALKGTQYKLPYNYNSSSHASAQNIYDDYSKHISYENVEKGDLVFLNFGRTSQNVTHIGIFVDKLSNNEFRFIDASDYSGYKKVVDFRKINPYDRAVIGFGEMKLQQKY